MRHLTGQLDARGKQHGADLSQLTPAEVNFIRTRVGSPDFLAGGTETGWTNELFLFSNAMIQGWRSDLKTMSEPETRGGYWMKTAMQTIAPKMLMLAAYNGVFGMGGGGDDDDEEGVNLSPDPSLWEMFQYIPKYELLNYLVYPLYRSEESGDIVYLRMPMDDTGRVISGVLFAIGDSLFKSYEQEWLRTMTEQRTDATGATLVDRTQSGLATALGYATDVAYAGGSALVSGIGYAAEGLPTVTPTLEIPYDLVRYAGAVFGDGKGPYDAY